MTDTERRKIVDADQKPSHIWVDWPQPKGTGLAFSCQARPPARRTEYILASIELVRIAALEAENARLREALKPFAMSGANLQIADWPDEASCLRAAFLAYLNDGALKVPTVGGLRRAAATLESKP